jgi:hypothetical protein
MSLRVGIMWFDFDPVFGVLMLCAIIPSVLGGFVYFISLISNKRQNLAKACAMVVYCNVAFFWVIFALVLLGKASFSDMIKSIANIGVQCLCFMYYQGVCERYAN